MKLTITSDIHGYFPKIYPCDIVIIGGDVFPSSIPKTYEAQCEWHEVVFMPWVDALPCQHVVLVPGNHDYYWEKIFSGCSDMSGPLPDTSQKLIVLCNQGVQLLGLKMYGTPNVPPALSSFAFTRTSEELQKIFSYIPDNLDILIAHGVPYGVGNLGVMIKKGTLQDRGMWELTEAIEKKNIRYVFCGHVHTGSHERVEWRGKILYNTSYCDKKKMPFYNVLELEI